MTKNELTDKIARKLNISYARAKEAVDQVFTAMSQELARGGRIEIRGSFVIHVKSYKAYTGRDPRNGRAVHVKEKRLPFFKAGKDISRRLNEH